MTPDQRAGLILRRIGTALEVPERAAEEVSLARVAVRDWMIERHSPTRMPPNFNDASVRYLLTWAVEDTCLALLHQHDPMPLPRVHAYLSAAIDRLVEEAS